MICFNLFLYRIKNHVDALVKKLSKNFKKKWSSISVQRLVQLNNLFEYDIRPVLFPF